MKASNEHPVSRLSELQQQAHHVCHTNYVTPSMSHQLCHKPCHTNFVTPSMSKISIHTNFVLSNCLNQLRPNHTCLQQLCLHHSCHQHHTPSSPTIQDHKMGYTGHSSPSHCTLFITTLSSAIYLMGAIN